MKKHSAQPVIIQPRKQSELFSSDLLALRRYSLECSRTPQEVHRSVSHFSDVFAERKRPEAHHEQFSTDSLKSLHDVNHGRGSRTGEPSSTHRSIGLQSWPDSQNASHRSLVPEQEALHDAYLRSKALSRATAAAHGPYSVRSSLQTAANGPDSSLSPQGNAKGNNNSLRVHKPWNGFQTSVGIDSDRYVVPASAFGRLAGDSGVHVDQNGDGSHWAVSPISCGSHMESSRGLALSSLGLQREQSDGMLSRSVHSSLDFSPKHIGHTSNRGESMDFASSSPSSVGLEGWGRERKGQGPWSVRRGRSEHFDFRGQSLSPAGGEYET